MELKQKIQEDLKTAMKAALQASLAPEDREKKELELSVLRMLSAAITNKEKEKRYKIVNKLRSSPPFANVRVSKEKPDLTENDLEKESYLTDEETTEVISTEVKKRKEALLMFEKGGRNDLAEKEKKEAAILQKYLPEQLSEEEVRKLAKEAVEKVGAKEIKDMGRVMAELMPKIKGKTDGGLVSKIIRESLLND